MFAVSKPRKIAQRLIRHDGTQILPGDLAGPVGAGGLLVNAMNVDPARAGLAFSSVFSTRPPIGPGIIFICCVMFFPGGIWGTLRQIRLRRRKP